MTHFVTKDIFILHLNLLLDVNSTIIEPTIVIVKATAEILMAKALLYQEKDGVETVSK